MPRRADQTAHRTDAAAKISTLDRMIAALEQRLADLKRQRARLRGGVASGQARTDLAQRQRIRARFIELHGAHGSVASIAREFRLTPRQVSHTVRDLRSTARSGRKQGAKVPTEVAKRNRAVSGRAASGTKMPLPRKQPQAPAKRSTRPSRAHVAGQGRLDF